MIYNNVISFDIICAAVYNPMSTQYNNEMYDETDYDAEVAPSCNNNK